MFSHRINLFVVFYKPVMEKQHQISPSEGGKQDNKKEDDNNVDELLPCKHCANQPCLTTVLEDNLVAVLETYRDWNTNKNIRFRMYKECVNHIHGPGLGKGVRKKLPLCVQSQIRDMAPDKENSYTGFIDNSNK